MYGHQRNQAVRRLKAKLLQEADALTVEPQAAAGQYLHFKHL